MKYFISFAIFIISAFFEVGGLYLIWHCRKDGKPIYWLVFGFLSLIVYGIISTLNISQQLSFAKSYSTYGGIFIAVSFIAAIRLENYKITSFDIIGSLIILIGCLIIFFGENIKSFLS